MINAKTSVMRAFYSFFLSNLVIPAKPEIDLNLKGHQVWVFCLMHCWRRVTKRVNFVILLIASYHPLSKAAGSVLRVLLFGELLFSCFFLIRSLFRFLLV